MSDHKARLRELRNARRRKPPYLVRCTWIDEITGRWRSRKFRDYEVAKEAMGDSSWKNIDWLQPMVLRP